MRSLAPAHGTSDQKTYHPRIDSVNSLPWRNASRTLHHAWTRQNSSGGKDRLGRISKKGDGYLRKLLVVGATSVIRRARTGAMAAGPEFRGCRLVEGPARAGGRIETIDAAARQAFAAGPGDHGGVVGA